jgi:Flp pilus assembly protein TadD
MGRAFSEVIGADLAKAPGVNTIPTARLRALDRTLGVRPVSAPGVSTERDAAFAAGATRIGYGTYAVLRGRLDAHLTVMDPRTGKVAFETSVSTEPGNIIAAAADLARKIDPHVIPYDTANAAALREYIQAQESSNPGEIASNASAAIAADPNFAAPYLTLAQAEASQGDRAGALGTLHAAMAHASAMRPADRARLQLDKAALENDPAARLQALADLAAASPNDPETMQAYAQAAFAAHDYARAVQAFHRVLASDANNIAALNSLGYAEAYSGNLSAAADALHRYQTLRPSDPNPVDSLGDVNLISGHLKEAEDFYLEAAKKGPGLLNGGDFFKAAMARLMTGDTAGADALFKQFTDFRAKAKDPAVDFYRAQWRWLSGRRSAAAADLAAAARATPALAPAAAAQLAIWDLAAGNRASAAQDAAKAGTQGLPAVLVRFLTLPPASPEDWNARAQKLAPQPNQSGIRDLLVSYALLLDGHFAPASSLLAHIYAAGEDSSEGLPVLLAWSYLETGRLSDASRLLSANPTPPAQGPSVLMPFYFPRLYLLRAEAAEKAGRAGEARTNRQLYQQLSGTGDSSATR